MLWLTLALIIGQDGGASPAPPRLPPGAKVDQVQRVWPDGSVTTYSSGRCAALLQRVAPSPERDGPMSSALPSMLHRDDQRVRMYYLLDRRIGGCPVPVVAVDHLPEADRAIGRTLPR